jgi:hypothetical protein
MSNLRYKVLRELLWVAAELHRMGKTKAAEACVRGYVSVTFYGPVVSSLAKLKQAPGVSDTIIDWLKEPKFRYEAVRCQIAPPLPGNYASVAECCLAIVEAEAQRTFDPAILIQQKTIEDGVRPLLDADPKVRAISIPIANVPVRT